MITQPPPLDIALFFPELAALARTTVRLLPRLTADLDVRASKLGGQILWPADEPWPRCTALEELPSQVATDRLLHPGPDGSIALDDVPAGHALHNDFYVPVLQLRQADVPELAFFPGTDLFQLLWCPRSHPEQYAPVCRAYWRTTAVHTSVLAAAPAPAWPDGELVPDACVLRPERVVEYPDRLALADALRERIEAWEETEAAGGHSYHYELSVAPGTKVGGYVGWHLEPEPPVCPRCGAVMAYLLTIGSGEGGGTPAADARWYGAAPSEEYLLIGRGGAATIFICRQHEDAWPVEL